MSRLRCFLISVFDYAALVLAAFIGTLVVVALLLWRNPDPEEIFNSGLPLAVAATGAVAAIFWFGPRRHSWFSGRPWMCGGVLAFIAGAGVLACFWLPALMRSFASVGGVTDMLWVAVQLGALLLILAGLFVVRRAGLRGKWWSFRLRVGVAAALVGAVVYLKRDEPVWPVVTQNQEALAGRNEDEATYRLTLRYSSGSDGGGEVFSAPRNKLSFPADAVKRRAYLLAHRAEIEANWAELAGVRAWWTEMASHEALGDRSSWDIDQSLIRFGPVRFYQQTALALAELQALDGDGDGAMMRVIEVYRVGANLERSTCTLVRGMIAVVVQKEALKTADFVLNHATVSNVTRTRLAELVASSPQGSSGIREMLLAEAMYASSSIRNISRLSWRLPSDGWHESLFASLGAGVRWLAFNPQATVNRVHARMAQAALLAAARNQVELDRLDKNMDEEQLGGFQVKNVAGRMMIPMISSSFEKIAKSFWEKEDLRAALVLRLRTQGEGK